MIANRISNLSFSTTMQINQKARQMKSEGIEIIDLSAGEPDFPTPDIIKDKAKKAIDNNFTRYTASSGTPELIHAVINRLKLDYSVSYQPNQIVVSGGAKHSLFNAFLAVLNHGDEVIIPNPYWVSYPEQVKMAEGVPVFVETDEADNFLLTAASLEAAVTERTKALILCNPSNPTGMIYPEDRLRELADVCLKHNILIIADEIYEKLVYDGVPFTSVCQLGEKYRNISIVVNGVSKAYSMTGWRIGYAAAPAQIANAMGIVQSHTTSNPSSVSQMAAIAALEADPQLYTYMYKEYHKRRNLVYERFCAIPNVRLPKPDGAFLAFINISAYFNTQADDEIIVDSTDLTHYLLEKAHVAVVPGKAFGMENYIRISYANPLGELEQAMDRITEALASLKPLA